MKTPANIWQDPNLERLLVEASPFGLLVLDGELRVLDFNRWVQVHLPHPEQLRGRPLKEAFPAIQEATLQALREVVQSGLPRILSPALHPAWLPLRHPLTNRPLQVVVRAFSTARQPGVFLLLEDITERIDYEATLEAQIAQRTALLREREALLRALDAATRQALQAVTDLPRLGGTLTQSFRRLFQAHDALLFILEEENRRLRLLACQGDLCPQQEQPSWRLTLSPLQRDHLRQGQTLWVPDLRTLLLVRGSFAGEDLPPRSAMLFPLRVVAQQAAHPLLGVLALTFPPRQTPPEHLEEQGMIVSRTLSLILHWALLYNQMQSQREALARAVDRRTQDLEAFVYSVSHDLRAPLRAISGYAQAVLEDYADQLPAEGQEFLQALLNAAGRMDHLIEDLLHYSRVAFHPPQIQPVALEDLLQEVLLDLHSAIQAKQAHITWKSPLPTLYADTILLRQILLNLLDNAVKFVPPERTPEVTLWVEETAFPRGVRIWVEDNGIGIPVEAQERIFRVFERLHSTESYPGSGIGLALVRRAAERMDGQVGVLTRPEAGSRFWVWLPQPEPESEAT